VIVAHIKTKSGDTRDVTGNVLSKADIASVFSLTNKTAADYPNINLNYTDPVTGRVYTRQENYSYMFSTQYVKNPQTGLVALTNKLDELGLDGIGTPPGLTGKADPSASTAGISLGYFLDDEYKWLVEAYVLAAPLSSSVSVQGQTTRYNADTDETITRPIGIAGQTAITTKIVPPMVMLGRYWGAKEAKFRPYTGAMAMYAIFVDTKATDVLNSYVGGANPGDTTVSIKNSLGFGPVIGFKYQLGDVWHASLNLASVKLKANATLTTRNTTITSGSQITQDLGSISDTIYTGEQVYGDPANSGCIKTRVCTLVNQNGGLTSLIMQGVAADKNQANGGTFVRKTDTTLDNTILFMSVGRSF